MWGRRRLTARRADRDAELLLLAATLALTAFYYFARADTIGVFSPARGWTPMTARPLSALWHFGSAVLLLGLFPVLLARRVTGLSAVRLGLGLGDWRRGIGLLVAGLPLAVLAGKIAAASPAMRAVYPLVPSVDVGDFPSHALGQILYIGAWEALFRGVLLFGLRERLGAGGANVLQTALSVIAHFGRALNETAAAFPAGLVFGWLTLKTGSIWYVAMIHWLVGVSMDWFIVTQARPF